MENREIEKRFLFDLEMGRFDDGLRYYRSGTYKVTLFTNNRTGSRYILKLMKILDRLGFIRHTVDLRTKNSRYLISSKKKNAIIVRVNITTKYYSVIRETIRENIDGGYPYVTIPYYVKLYHLEPKDGYHVLWLIKK